MCTCTDGTARKITTDAEGIISGLEPLDLSVIPSSLDGGDGSTSTTTTTTTDVFGHIKGLQHGSGGADGSSSTASENNDVDTAAVAVMVSTTTSTTTTTLEKVNVASPAPYHSPTGSSLALLWLVSTVVTVAATFYLYY